MAVVEVVDVLRCLLGGRPFWGMCEGEAESCHEGRIKDKVER